MMIMRRGISRWFMQIGVLASALALFACTKVMAEDPYVEAINVIKRSVVTVSVLPGREVFVITPNGQMLDARKLPSLDLPSSIGGGKNITVSAISVVAVGGSPVEVRGNFGFGPVCYVFDDQTGVYLGDCPKEKY